jgi:hypothetical protein
MFRRFPWSPRPAPKIEEKDDEPQEVILPVLPEENPKAIKPIFKDKKPTS